MKHYYPDELETWIERNRKIKENVSIDIVVRIYSSTRVPSNIFYETKGKKKEKKKKTKEKRRQQLEIKTFQFVEIKILFENTF